MLTHRLENVVSKQTPAARPNSVFLFMATSSHSSPLPAISLSPAGWATLLVNYPDPKFSETICMIAKYGARVGYEGPIQAIRRPNLVSAWEAPEVIDRDLESNLKHGRIVEIQELGPRFMVSP